MVDEPATGNRTGQLLLLAAVKPSQLYLSHSQNVNGRVAPDCRHRLHVTRADPTSPLSHGPPDNSLPLNSYTSIGLDALSVIHRAEEVGVPCLSSH